MTAPARKRHRVWLAVLLIFGALITWAAISIWREVTAQTNILPQVCQRYGIEIGSPYVRVGAVSREFIVFGGINENSPLMVAGVNNGDILLVPKSLGKFARLLDKPPGSIIKITVAEGGHGVPLSDRTQRTLTFKAPQ